MKVVSEKSIMRLFRAGAREKAFRLLVGRYSEPLYWHIRKLVLCHDDADDILQNVFVKVWFALDGFRNDSKIYTWMHSIATHESINFLNEKRRKVFGNEVGISDMLENTLESDEFFDGNEAEMALQRALLRLSERQRLIFNMRYFENMSNEDVAEELGVAVGTIKATYHQAVKKIKNEIKWEGWKTE